MVAAGAVQQEYDFLILPLHRNMYNLFLTTKVFKFVVDSYFVHYVKKSFLLTHVKHLLILRSLSESLFKVPLVSFIIFSFKVVDNEK